MKWSIFPSRTPTKMNRIHQNGIRNWLSDIFCVQEGKTFTTRTETVRLLLFQTSNFLFVGAILKIIIKIRFGLRLIQFIRNGKFVKRISFV